MTLDEILTRWNAANPIERNLWVVETVLGWQWWSVPIVGDIRRTIQPPGFDPKKDTAMLFWKKTILPLSPPDYGGVKPFADRRIDVPNVSTNRGEVWQVVDAMREKGYIFRLFQQERDWHAHFKKPGEFTIWPAEQVHVCEAVCLAALIALEKDRT